MKAKIDFILNNVFYSKDDEVKCNDFEKIISLNEKGFIYPLTTKELHDIKNKIENSTKKEDKQWQH